MVRLGAATPSAVDSRLCVTLSLVSTSVRIENSTWRRASGSPIKVSNSRYAGMAAWAML